MGRVFVKGVTERSTSMQPRSSGRALPEASRQSPVEEVHDQLACPPTRVAVDHVPRPEACAVFLADDYSAGLDAALSDAQAQVLESRSVPP
jgi:hypothetical protein